LFEAVERLPGIRVTGLYTHYASAEDDAEFTSRQKNAFSQVVAMLASRGKQVETLHSSNSGGLLLEQPDPCNLVRAGLLVYGVLPEGKRLTDSPLATGFRPALSWKCRISLVREVPAGSSVGYGRTYVTAGRMRLATLTAGYGDGYSRAASNRAQVLVRGRRCAVLGRVSMDQMVADVSTMDGIKPGEEVVLIGRQDNDEICASELARWAGTIPWEVLTNITYRVPRLYRGGHAA
jgi:alanine racemase